MNTGASSRAVALVDSLKSGIECAASVWLVAFHALLGQFNEAAAYSERTIEERYPAFSRGRAPSAETSPQWSSLAEQVNLLGEIICLRDIFEHRFRRRTSLPVVLPASILKFGVFELDCGRCELRRKVESLRIEHKPMRFLIQFVSQEGQSVTRTEIAERLISFQINLPKESTVARVIAYRVKPGLGFQVNECIAALIHGMVEESEGAVSIA